MLDQAFEALKTYDWGTDPNQLAAIDEAIATSAGNDGVRKELESRLAAVLTTGVSRAAKDHVCRKLMLMGGAASVPALAALLTDEGLSHMARHALERIPAPEAGAALRDALPKTKGNLQIGIVGSLGSRGETAGVSPLAALLSSGDAALAAAAAKSLGQIRTAEASKALSECKSADAEVKLAVTDARLACAERFLSEGQKDAALSTYKTLTGEDQPKHVRLAATRGVLACSKKS